MTFDFPDIPLVRAHAQAGERKLTAQVALAMPWNMMPPEAPHWVTGRLRMMLHHEGMLCDRCADLTSGDLTRPCLICAPVRMTLLSGGIEYPLIEDGDLPYGSPDPARQLLLIAVRHRELGLMTSRLEVDANTWVASGPETWDELMQHVAGQLVDEGEDDPGAEIRTFLCDRGREIPFPRRTTLGTT
ncbi:hypothetical protein [Streptomyces rimosus]|uniref:hypothetical protein n=1 Tax=Streptomyces rimosus TaxID=1927 RepID=UPI0004C1B55E|nr:hypothetical protein [Streptomyces rimosus]